MNEKSSKFNQIHPLIFFHSNPNSSYTIVHPMKLFILLKLFINSKFVQYKKIKCFSTL